MVPSDAPTGNDDWPVPIDVLAQRVGLTPRNIRAHQTRGTLPPPVRRGKVAWYDARHAAVLQRIRQLQDRGYSLAAIDELLRAGDDAAVLQRLVLAPLLEHDEIVLTWPQIAGMYDQRPSRDRYRRAVASGLVTVDPDGNLVAPSARLLQAARELFELGVPFQEMFDLQVEVAERSTDVGRRFVELCLDRALEPYDGSPPPEQWQTVTQRFEHLYRLMTSVLMASFTIGVRRAAETLLAERGGGASPGDDAAGRAPCPD